MIKNCLTLILPILYFTVSVNGELPLNKKPPLLELKEKCGGRLNGTPWSSAEITGKVYSCYYIDPDEADLNEPLFTALKAEDFPKKRVQSVAIINMKATWLPKTILNLLLKRKQKKYSSTTYVNDYCRKGVTEWNLADHSSDVLIFGPTGDVLFSKDGKLTDGEIKKVISIIWNALGGKESGAND